MLTQAGVGISHHRNPQTAGQEAAKQALSEAGIDDRPDFVFMFASVGYNQRELLDSVRAATGRAPLVGCSGEGIIAAGEADESNFSVAVMAIRSDAMRFYNTFVTDLSADAEAAGRRLAEAVVPAMQPDSAALMLFPDGITVNFDRVRAGLEGALDRRLPLFGGTAADNFVWAHTFQYCDDEIISDGIAAVLLSGPMRFAWDISHSCFPLGTERTVTRASGNVIHEIDHKPVMEVIKEYLAEGEWGQIIGNLPLGFVVPNELSGYDEYVVRVITAQIEDGITLPTEVEEGTTIWIMRRDQEKIGAGVKELAQRVKSAIGEERPHMVFHFDCGGRGKIVLREQQKAANLAELRGTIGEDVPWIGFYSFGEIGPVGEQNLFHNWTAVVLAVY